MRGFDASVIALLDNPSVLLCPLLQLEFTSGTRYVWSGQQSLTTLDGQTWQGLGSFAGMSGVQGNDNLDSHGVSFFLGLDNNIVTIDISSNLDIADVRGRRARLYLQFFNDNGALIGNPQAVRSFIMSHSDYSRDDETGRGHLKLHADDLFAGRKKPAWGRLTNQDQQKRYSGDFGLAFATDTTKDTVLWPSN